MLADDSAPPRLLIIVLVGTALVLTALLCLEALRADAAEPDAANAWLAEVKQARRDTDALAQIVRRAAEAHNAEQDAKLRKKIRSALGAILKDRKAGSARVAAAAALGALDDVAAAYKLLKSALPAAKTEAPEPHQFKALEALGVLKCDAAIGDLVKLTAAAKSREVGRLAINALGEYGKSSKRESALKGLLTTTAKLQAGAEAARRKASARRGKAETADAGTTKTSEAEYAWRAYEPALLAALNKLTGQSQGSVGEWLSLYEENKRKLSALFREESR